MMLLRLFRTSYFKATCSAASIAEQCCRDNVEQHTLESRYGKKKKRII
ncbi:MAG: hypothetical protein ACTTH7_06375 [Treponema sp.]